jgi:hypothetical protein
MTHFFGDEYLQEAKEYVMNKLKETTYPPNHPFLHKDFANDYVFYILCLLKVFIKETNMIDDYICNKMVSAKNGVFDLEMYYQNLYEVMIIYYLLVHYINSDLCSTLQTVVYEPPGAGNKKLEYSLVIDGTKLDNFDNIYINVEVKTITCDPFIQESGVHFRNGQKFIKPLFKDVDLKTSAEGINLDNYIILEHSTHTRQISKKIKEISSKFEQYTNTINIGFIVINHATSLEEFFTYLFHPEKGLLFNLDFNNIDCLVFFSLTATPDFLMEDMYERNHVFSLLFDKRPGAIKYYEALGLDNFASIDNEVSSLFKEYANREYGLYKWIVINDLGFFVSEGTSSEAIKAYVEEISQKINPGID